MLRLIICIAFIAASCAANTRRCKLGGTVIGGTCYFKPHDEAVGGKPVNLGQAQKLCEKHNGGLPRPQSLEEDSGLFDIEIERNGLGYSKQRPSDGDMIHLDLMKVSPQGSITWSDGQPLKWDNFDPQRPTLKAEFPTNGDGDVKLTCELPPGHSLGKNIVYYFPTDEQYIESFEKTISVPLADGYYRCYAVDMDTDVAADAMEIKIKGTEIESYMMCVNSVRSQPVPDDADPGYPAEPARWWYSPARFCGRAQYVCAAGETSMLPPKSKRSEEVELLELLVKKLAEEA